MNSYSSISSEEIFTAIAGKTMSGKSRRIIAIIVLIVLAILIIVFLIVTGYISFSDPVKN
jgi:hypothetical protein